jgi:protein-disulfide isomerase
MSSRTRQKQANRVVREQLARQARRRRLVAISIGAVCAVLIAAVAGYLVYQAQKPPAATATPAHATSDKHGIQVSSGTVQVELYVDYLCPVCKRFEDTASSTLDQMVAAGKITLIYRPIAILDNNTNPSGYSTRAGSAAGCAADSGKFLEYTKALYAQQPAEGSSGLTDDKLIQIGDGVGLTGDPFSQCVNTSKYSGWMANNTDAAAGRHIQGTPTVVVAGKQIDATVDALNAAVSAAAK